MKVYKDDALLVDAIPFNNEILVTTLINGTSFSVELKDGQNICMSDWLADIKYVIYRNGGSITVKTMVVGSFDYKITKARIM